MLVRKEGQNAIAKKFGRAVQRVRVPSDQSLASRSVASLAASAVTLGPMRRSREWIGRRRYGLEIPILDAERVDGCEGSNVVSVKARIRRVQRGVCLRHVHQGRPSNLGDPRPRPFARAVTKGKGRPEPEEQRTWKSEGRIRVETSGKVGSRPDRTKAARVSRNFRREP